MHSICVHTVTWVKRTDSCNIVASVHMRTCRPVRTPLLRACQPAVPNPLIFTLLKPLFFSPIQLLSHTHCSSHPSSCCPTPTVLLTHQATVPHPLFFSHIQLLSHTHCSSHPSSCCPTPANFLTYRLLSHTHCSHPSTHCPTPTPELLSPLPLITLHNSLPAPHHSELLSPCPSSL